MSLRVSLAASLISVSDIISRLMSSSSDLSANILSAMSFILSTSDGKASSELFASLPQESTVATSSNSLMVSVPPARTFSSISSVSAKPRTPAYLYSVSSLCAWAVNSRRLITSSLSPEGRRASIAALPFADDAYSDARLSISSNSSVCTGSFIILLLFPICRTFRFYCQIQARTDL